MNLIGVQISRGIRIAAKHWQESGLDFTEKVINLEKDIKNAPLHYLGCHENCSEYFCSKETHPESVDNIALLKDDGLYYEILDLCYSYFGTNVKSLLMNFSNNAVEEINGLIAKYLGML